jgi:hypothetical protein
VSYKILNSLILIYELTLLLKPVVRLLISPWYNAFPTLVLFLYFFLPSVIYLSLFLLRSYLLEENSSFTDFPSKILSTSPALLTAPCTFCFWYHQRHLLVLSLECCLSLSEWNLCEARTRAG